MKDRNYGIYFTSVIVTIIVYLVIYLFGSSTRQNILEEASEYENNLAKQPINNILCAHDDKSGSNNNNNSNTNTNNDNDNDNNILFRYESDEGDYIELYNQFPTKDEVGMAFSGNKYTHNFRLKLSSYATGVHYTITLKKQPGSTLDDKWAKTYLVSDGESVSSCFRNNGRIKTFDEYHNYLLESDEKVLYTGVVSYAEAMRGYKNFTLRMWVSEDLKVSNENYLEKSFKTKITVYAIK